LGRIIEVEELTKTFRLSRKRRKTESAAGAKKTAVDRISFSVDAGEIFGLLGPNGAGKTTTMRIIATLIKADSGRVFVDGEDIKEQPLKIRRKIGFLTGDLKLDDFFTPAYLFDFFAGLRGIDKKESRRRRDILFKRFGIWDYAHERISALSGGMKQKAALVISVAHDPDIIIFDEPTNGLDIVAAKMVTDFLPELKKQGKTIILSTHIFNLAEKVCDRVGIMLDGKLVKCGAMDAVTGKGSLEQVFFSLYDACGQISGALR
jgi:sodium transport system ATP-binding protein